MIVEPWPADAVEKSARVSEALEKLAAEGSADAIALRLQAEGVTGVVGLTTRCAVANWLFRETGMVVGVSACLWKTLGAPAASPPALVADFILAFDQGDYPALIAPSEPTDAA